MRKLLIKHFLFIYQTEEKNRLYITNQIFSAPTQLCAIQSFCEKMLEYKAEYPDIINNVILNIIQLDADDRQAKMLEEDLANSCCETVFIRK